uniref:Tyrosine-protein phosphatase domain-containing protein n=2 Tax=Homalodisca TaxID=139475 RepID=A0A1B6HWI4_9HEMI
MTTQDDSEAIFDPYTQLRTSNSPNDWKYSMRRTMQQVVPRVFLGPYSAAQRTKLDVLRQHGITHIVCVRQDVEAHFIRPNFPDVFQYLVLNIADSPTENIIQHFSKVKQFIDGCHAGGGKALIHGNGGISRSAALAVAFVMETYSLSLKDAFTLVQQSRFCINPNEGFMAQLAEFEPIYKAHQTMLLGQSSEGAIRYKRPLDR